MGLWSPEAYDALLLEKVKTLLSVALNSSKQHEHDATTYEHFVLDLDVQDEGSKTAIGLLIHETVVRRSRTIRVPRPPHAIDESSSASTSNSTAGPSGISSVRRTVRGDAAWSEPALQLEAASRAQSNIWRIRDEINAAAAGAAEQRMGTRPRGRPARRVHVIASSSSSSDSDEAEFRAAAREMPGPETGLLPRLSRASDHRSSTSNRRMSWRRFLSENAGPDLTTFDSTLGATTSGATASAANNDPISSITLDPTSRAASTFDHEAPSQAYRDLFGSPPPPPRVARVQPRASMGEVWSTLFDEVPFPIGDVDNVPFPLFLTALNESGYSTTPFECADLATLREQLQERDPSFNIRLRNTQRRHASSRLLHELRYVGSGGGRSGVSIEAATQEDREITRARTAADGWASRAQSGFMEHVVEDVADDVMADWGEDFSDAYNHALVDTFAAIRDDAFAEGTHDDDDDDEESSPDRRLFERFAQRRRARLRRSHGQAEDDLDEDDEGDEEALHASLSHLNELQASLRAASGSSTDTPATSIAPSPPQLVAAACPPVSTAPARPLTSAQIAEAAARANRRIASVPTSAASSSSSNPTANANINVRRNHAELPGGPRVPRVNRDAYFAVLARTRRPGAANPGGADVDEPEFIW